MVPFTPGEGASETATAKFHALVVDELRARGDLVEVVPAPSQKAAPPAPTPEKPAQVVKRGPSAETLAALESGKKAFDELRFEDAVTNLRKGIEGMLGDPATADYESVTDAYVKLAASAFRMGEEKEAKTALLDFARFAPTYELSAGFPPVFQREFEKAKKRLEKQPKGGISIDGPSGSTAFINGRDLGMVPISDEVVPSGTHYVKVEGPKGEKWGQAVNVTGGSVKVKASFGSAVERAPVVAQKPSIPETNIAASLDTGAPARLTSYLKAVNAEWALVGYVYKTSDSQLTAGTALFSLRRSQFSALTPVSFDTDVLTANTEAFKIGEELATRLMSFGTAASLPFNLAARPAKAGTTTVARKDAPTSNTEDLDLAAPVSKKVALTPRAEPQPEVKQVVLDETPVDLAEKAPEAAKSGVPAWVWVVTGVAVAAGAGVGGYFGITALTKPVTGTVTATW